MADDTNTTSRLTITVPDPLTRINLGKPIEGDEPLGYTGLTLKSDYYLFVDINKSSFFQGGATQWQSGGVWLQYANGDMVLSSGATNMMSADGKVTLVAGAGHGGVSALDHGQPHVAPRFDAYNNLDLHYRVEEVHNGMRKLFYGDAWKTAANKLQADQIAANAGATPDPGYPALGLLGKTWTFLDGFDVSKADRVALLEPLEWKGNFKEMKNGWPSSVTSSVYPALRTFDPYPAAQFNNGFGETFAQFLQTMNFFHRTADLLAKVMPFITDGLVVKRINNFVAVWGHAQEAANATLNIADIARWNRLGDRKAREGGGFADEAAAFKARVGPAEGFADTAATLESAADPYNFTGLPASDLYFEVRSIEGGTKQRVSLAGTAATVTLTLGADYKSIDVALGTAGAPASVTVGGQVASYDGSTWSLPQGFTVTGARISRSDGAFFAAVAGTNTTISEATSDALTVVIDGTTYAVSLSTVTGAGSSARATALADAINTQRSGSAVASGSSVTITGATLGPSGEISVGGGADALSRVGATSSVRANGYGQNTAAAVAAAMAGKGTFDAEAKDGKITATHQVTGDTSYLEISGPLASRIWGADPAIAKGESKDGYKNFETMRSLQNEVAKWPEDTKNLFRPVLHAFRDVMEVADHIKGIGEEVLKFLGALPDPAKMLGLFAADGITLGTGGPMLAYAPDVTLIAAPKDKADPDKYALGPVEKFLVEGPEWEALKKLKESLTPGWFDVPDKERHKREGADYGGFRVVSAKQIALISLGSTRVVAHDEAIVQADKASVVAKSSATVAALDGLLSLAGKTMVIGALEQAGKQSATTELSIGAAKLSIETANLIASFDAKDGKIDLGAVGKDANSKSQHVVDCKLPRLVIDKAKAVEIGIGDNAGAVEEGVSVTTGGAVAITSKGAVKLTGGTIDLAGTTSVTGDFKVGAAFSVKGDGSAMTTPAIPTVALPNPRLATLPTEYAGVMTAARAIQASLVASKAALKEIDDIQFVRGLAVRAMVFAKSASAKALKGAIDGQRAQLLTLKAKWTALKDEATLLHLANYGQDPGDEAVFGA